MIEEILLLLGVGCLGMTSFISGICVGWVQRDKDKARDALKLADAILRSCDRKAKADILNFKNAKN